MKICFKIICTLFLFAFGFHLISTPSVFSQIVFPGDANQDARVDGQDYIIWLNNFNMSTTNGARQGDFNNSGRVEGQDYLLWLSNFGKTGMVPTQPPSSGSVLSGGLGVARGFGLEVGINVTKFNQLKQEATTGVYDRKCTSSEHDTTKWHPLVNPVAKCHYDHHHGDDPNFANDVCAIRPDGSQVCFGTPGEWFGKPGQEISHPWQTFKLPTGVTNRYITAEDAGATNGLMENQAKHEPYVWVVRRDQNCPGTTPCTTDFRVLLHGAMFTPEALTRYHSIAVEQRVCRNPQDPRTCGILRFGGWADWGILMTPNYDGYDCSGVGSRRFGDPAIETYLKADELFFPIYPEGHPDRHRNYPPGVDERFRCHNNLTDAQVKAHIANGETAILDQWWHRDPARIRYLVADPIGNTQEVTPGSQQFTVDFFCEMDPATGVAQDPNCRMNNSKVTAQFEYTTALGSTVNGTRIDSNGDGRTDMTRQKNIYQTRWGNPGSNCTAPSLDCIPYVADNIELNFFNNTEGQYDHFFCSNRSQCPLLDHDLTPAGKPSWVSWFYKHAGM